VFYLAGQHGAAIQALDGLIDEARAAGQPTPEIWHQLQLSSYSELKNDTGVFAALEHLALHFPKRAYWGEYFRAYKRQPGLDPDLRHNLYRLMYDTGLMQNGLDVVNAVEHSMRLRLPGEALMALQRGKERKVFTGANNLQVQSELTADAEKAAALDRKGLAEVEAAARAARGGELDVQLGYSLFTDGQFDKAAEAIARGQKKGGVKRPAEADLMLGRAFLKLNRRDEAEAAFRRVVAGTDAGLAGLARFWLAYARNPAVIDS
jgi:hypothetical protein